MQTTFTSGADFSGVIGRSDLFINDIIHQPFVGVNGQGTEAATATGAGNVMNPNLLTTLIVLSPFSTKARRCQMYQVEVSGKCGEKFYVTLWIN